MRQRPKIAILDGTVWEIYGKPVSGFRKLEKSSKKINTSDEQHTLDTIFSQKGRIFGAWMRSLCPKVTYTLIGELLHRYDMNQCFFQTFFDTKSKNHFLHDESAHSYIKSTWNKYYLLCRTHFNIFYSGLFYSKFLNADHNPLNWLHKSLMGCNTHFKKHYKRLACFIKRKKPHLEQRTEGGRKESKKIRDLIEVFELSFQERIIVWLPVKGKKAILGEGKVN